MTLSYRSPLLALGAGFGLSLLSALPAAAHGLASGGLLAGGLHPLLGLDHLLLLVGVAAAAVAIDRSLLLFALGGALVGGAFGAFGVSLPLAELLAALAVSAVGLLVWRRPQAAADSPGLGLPGSVIAAAMAVHGLLHGQAASGEPLWWLAAGASSLAVVLVAMAVLSRLGAPWRSRLALGLVCGGGLLALVPLG